MNKLQKLFESKILFNIGNAVAKESISAWLWSRPTQRPLREMFNKIEDAIFWLWEEAKKHSPDAECFKEEGASK